MGSDYPRLCDMGMMMCSIGIGHGSHLVLHVLVEVIDGDWAVAEASRLICYGEVVAGEQTLEPSRLGSVRNARFHDPENVSSDEAVAIPFHSPYASIYPFQFFYFCQEYLVR